MLITFDLITNITFERMYFGILKFAFSLGQ